MENRITLEKFCDEMRDIFRFGEEDEFTMKWLDEEGLWMSVPSKRCDLNRILY